MGLITAFLYDKSMPLLEFIIVEAYLLLITVFMMSMLTRCNYSFEIFCMYKHIGPWNAILGTRPILVSGWIVIGPVHAGIQINGYASIVFSSIFICWMDFMEIKFVSNRVTFGLRYFPYVSFTSMHAPIDYK